ncbi:MAG: hypothetical protein FWE16_02315 [Firmicutes bacterium]|nr:hypothetical protein [Bacillota bacterium]
MKQKKSSQDTVGEFGRDFQANAAIFLFVKNLKESSYVKNESAHEDIEIGLTNKKKIYAQAKAVETSTDTRNVIQKLKDAVNTLNAAKTNDSATAKLTYITNSKSPFKITNPMENSINGLTSKPFSELTPVEQAVVRNAVNDQDITNFAYDDFYILVIPFEGQEDAERYKEIKVIINELFAAIGKSDSGLTPTVMSVWQNMLRINASKRIATVTKEAFLWPIVVLYCGGDAPQWLRDEKDEGIIEAAMSKFRSLIDFASLDFQLVTRVINDYDEYISKHQLAANQQIKTFVTNSYEKYDDAFDSISGEDGAVKEIVKKIVINQILIKRTDIKKLKAYAGL